MKIVHDSSKPVYFNKYVLNKITFLRFTKAYE